MNIKIQRKIIYMSILDDDDKIRDLELELSTKDYDPVKYVNTSIPDSASISTINVLSKHINSKLENTSNLINDDIKICSKIDTSDQKLLDGAQERILNLSNKIDQIKVQADDTEKSVRNICAEIEPLHRAKNNLLTAVTTLRRLQMMASSIVALEKHIETKNYAECAPNVLALTTLVEDFKKYEKAPQLSPLITKFYDLKRYLRNQVNTELDYRLFGGKPDESNLAICAVVDAFADDFRSSTIDWFCDKFLSCYDNAFEGTDLSEAQNRFRWFKQRLTIYNNQFAVCFPTTWRMQYWITLSFCQRTCQQFKYILQQQRPQPKLYLNAFELTVKFESKMSESFATIEVVPYDPDAPMPSFPQTAEGVRQKHEWLQRMKEKRGTTQKVLATKFIGSIAAAFSPYMQIYIDAEKSTLTKIIAEAQQNIFNDIDPEEKELNSARTLIIAMKKSLEKCAGFGVERTILELFSMLRDNIATYTASMTKLLPRKFNNEDNIKVVCCIANTTSTLLEILDSLAQKVIEITTDEKKVTVDDAKNLITDELRKQILHISDTFVKESESQWIAIGNNSWTGGDPLPSKLIDLFNTRFGIISEWLSPMNMNRLRVVLMPKIVVTIRESLFKTHGLSIEATSKIYMCLKDVKDTIAYWTKCDSSSAKRRLEHEFARLENELTILCCPVVAMTVTYLGKTQTKSKEQFMALVKLKGLSPQQEAQISQEYDQQLPLFTEK